MFLLLLALLLLLIYFYLTKNHNYWQNRKIKHDRPLPLFGNIYQNITFKKSTTEKITELYNKYPNEKVVGFYSGTTPELIIRDLELVKKVLSTDFEYFYVRGLGRDPKREPLFMNLFHANGDSWRLLRQRLTSAFTAAKMKKMFPLVVECSEQLQNLGADIVHNGGDCDARELMARFTTDVIAACGFGLKADSIQNEHSLFRNFGKQIFKRNRSWSNLVLGILHRLLPDIDMLVNKFFSDSFIINTTTDILQTVIAQRNNKPSDRHDFIDLLMELAEKGKMTGESIEKKQRDGSPLRVEMEMDLKCMAAQVFVFFAGGFETSASVSSYVLHELAHHPEQQERIQKDIDTVLARYDNKMCYESIAEMKLLNQAFKEAMRKFSSAGALYRVCVRRYEIPELGITLDPGVKVVIPLQAIHNDEKYFKNASQFNPDRFADTSSWHKYSYMPFGEGPRSCIAVRLGYMQSLAGLVAVLRQFSFEPSLHTKRVPEVNHMSNSAQAFKGGLPLKMTLRCPNTRAGAVPTGEACEAAARHARGTLEALRRQSRQIAAAARRDGRERRVQFTERARDGARNGDTAESGGSEMSAGSGDARRPSTCRVELGALLAPEPRPLDNKVKRHSIHGMTEEENVVRPHQEMAVLSLDEKKYLLGVERGDVAGTRRVLQRARDTGHINVDCVDPLGRSALLMAIDNENLEMVELLLEFDVETRDALLHAISEEFVEAVEALLDHEERTRKPGEPNSWEALPPETATFTADITPLILAAHRDSFEIIKLLLDRGAQLPVPHDVRCGCDECVRSRREDSLRHSRSRINAYRALASPSLIALSSKDPILTAFELSWELRRLSALEHEFKTEYQELRSQCQEFATALLDHTRTSHELQVLLNHETGSPQVPLPEPGVPERMRLSRLKLAIKLRQKKFVAHPNVQQLLASIWYESVPGFRRKNMLLQAAEMVRIGAMFPLYAIAYVVAPHSTAGRTLRKPFIKFLCHSASYFMFLFLLILASQRIETAASGLLWGETAHSEPVSRRGAPPSLVEWLILAWVSGLIWSEVKQLWDMGLREYVHDMWNVIDFVTNSLYVATVALRIVSHCQVRREMAKGLQWNQPREKWDAWDPMLLSEGLFSAANIFSSLKLVYIFSVNPHLGPLQVSLSRMVLDILKFFVLDILVIFAFSCGLNQLLWYYADMEKKKCTTGGTSLSANGTLPDPDACVVWRRFANLFETMQTLFWAAFGLVDLDSFELDGIKIFTRFWGMLMFGTYAVINVIVLLNLLIAMMNHSYQLISERADVEWKFARSKLWISYFEEGGTAPPPFNVLPSPKSLLYAWCWLQRRLCGHARAKREHMRTIRRKAKQANERDFRYQAIMRNLVRRYVTVQQRRAESGGVTEDDVNEIKQDVSAFRCELVEILRNSGMNTSTVNAGAPGGGGGKKNRQKERRLMKGLNIVPGGQLAPVDEFLASLHHEHGGAHGAHHASLSALLGGRLRASQSSLSDGAGPRRKPSHKRRWGTIIEAARAARVSRLIGRSRSEDSVCDAQQSPSGSDRSDSGSDSQRSPERSTRSGPLHPLTALAALKRKRKKFSDSRRAACEARAAAAPEALQRASSVPARAPPLAPAPPRAPPPLPASVSPSTTAESVAGRGGSREPLLASLDDDAHKEACGRCGYEAGADAEGEAEAGAPCARCAALARLAGVTPLHGHAPQHSAGWL